MEQQLSKEVEQKIFHQVRYLTNNAIETRTGRYMCFYDKTLLIGHSPQELHLLLDCIWR